MTEKKSIQPPPLIAPITRPATAEKIDGSAKSSTQQLLEEITKLRIANDKLVEREQERESVAKFRALMLAATARFMLSLNAVFIAMNNHNGMLLFWLACTVWLLFFALPAKWLPFRL